MKINGINRTATTTDGTAGTDHEATVEQVSKRSEGSRRRGARRAALVLGLATTAVVSASAAANASVNLHGAPYGNWHLNGTNCHAIVGAVKTNNGDAMGGVDVYCGSNQNIVARAVEYRWNGSYWQHWSSSNFRIYGNTLHVNTTAICGGGPAQWYTAAYVSINGESYGPLNSSSVTSPYTPPAC